MYSESTQGTYAQKYFQYCRLQVTTLSRTLRVCLILLKSNGRTERRHGSTVPDGDVRADSITAATPATAFIVDEHAAAPAHADPLW